MEKTQFDKLMSALETRIALCKSQLGAIHTTADISRLSINQAVEIKSFCIAEEELMTKISMVDLYHIIGMGNLSPVQMMKFTYAIRDYLEYRPLVKAITKHLDSITDLPKIPVTTQYKLLGLCDLTLIAGEGDVVNDTASVLDYTKLKTAPLPYQIKGSVITVDVTQLEYFVTLISTLFKTNLSVDTFKQKLAARKEYFGICWTDMDSFTATGLIKSSETQLKLANYFNSHI